MENFFRAISLIMANQLRILVEESIKEFLKLFFAPVNDPIFETVKGHPPVFAVKLLLVNDTMKFEPSLEDLRTVAEELFDRILTSLDRIPRVESQLFTTSVSSDGGDSKGTAKNHYSPDICINVAFQKTYPNFVAKHRTELQAGLKALLKTVESHCSVYEDHQIYINQSAFKDVENFLHSNQTLSKQVDVCES
jgi:dynein heavy chain